MEPQVTIESNLPDRWVPDGAAIFVAARLDDDGVWESLIPEFAIAGRGGSADDALVNALELLDDYFVLCAREGRSFEEARRAISRETALPVIAELLTLVAGRKLVRGRRPRRDREYRIPLSLVGAH